MYYEDGVMMRGASQLDWDAMPRHGVQYLVLMEPVAVQKWRLAKNDRQMWTGEDVYSLYGWSVKYGSLIDDDIYFAMYERVVTE